MAMFNSYLQLEEGMAKSGNPSGFHWKIFENMRNTWVFERAMTSFTAHTHTSCAWSEVGTRDLPSRVNVRCSKDGTTAKADARRRHAPEQE